MRSFLTENVLCYLIKYFSILLIFFVTVIFLLIHVDGRISKLLVGQGALEVNFEGGAAGFVEENKSDGFGIVGAAIKEIEGATVDQVTDVALFYAVNGMKYSGKPAFTPYQVCTVLKMVAEGAGFLKECSLREFQKVTKAIEVLYSAYLLERFTYASDDPSNPRYGFNRLGRDFAAMFLEKKIVSEHIEDQLLKDLNMDRRGKIEELNQRFLQY